MQKKTLTTLLMLALLTACAGDGSSKNPAMKAQGSWKEIGKINEGNIDVSYDTGSLKRQGDTATLTDRKYVHKPSKENYRNTPEYKYAISQWAFQCDARNFRITQAQFFNDKGVSLAKHQYSAGQTRLLKQKHAESSLHPCRLHTQPYRNTQHGKNPPTSVPLQS